MENDSCPKRFLYPTSLAAPCFRDLASAVHPPPPAPCFPRGRDPDASGFPRRLLHQPLPYLVSPPLNRAHRSPTALLPRPCLRLADRRKARRFLSKFFKFCSKFVDFYGGLCYTVYNVKSLIRYSEVGKMYALFPTLYGLAAAGPFSLPNGVLWKQSLNPGSSITPRSDAR